ncbi:hemerythrin HHE cation binding domain-containing protein [Roridomyces roridus]|uniref:Hemerythrin HHE cation binding domain-containing protein n=1 Tax=Roridomyces roridus TaxID=1738132 RepID=A0AAD7G019_9AGAR|nr:hemerythrin HHE cation binding domain-containing protein [Roridomyces roridus]
MSTSTDREERRWNRISETMQHFHSYFKQEFDTVYELADGSFTKRGLNLARYLGLAKQLNHHLTMHHTIEERHIFPVLAKRMPQFSTETDDAHIASHKGIHDGLDALEVLVKKYTEEPSTYSPTEMRECLDGFRGVLFKHLDEEVADLQGENMKKYWTLEELEAIPM